MALDTNAILQMLLMSGNTSGNYDPTLLNPSRQAQRASDKATWQSGVNTAKNTALQNVRNQFANIGDAHAADPYLAAIEADYGGLHYRDGTDYSIDPNYVAPVAAPYVAPDTSWNEQAYLAANPDVANSYGFGRRNEPAYFQSGLDHYNRIGKNENRAGVTPGYGGTPLPAAPAAPVAKPTYIGGTADSYDDPNQFSGKDYGTYAGVTKADGTQAESINDIRTKRKDAAFSTSLNDTNSRLYGSGLNADDQSLLFGKIRSKFDNLYNAAGLSADDYSGAFDGNAVYDDVLSTERTNRRGSYTTQARAAFNGVDPNADFADTADDGYISDIIGRQYGDAEGALSRARARGALTDSGYSAGLNTLGDARTAGTATANALGGAVLTRNRGELDTIKNKAVTDAGAYDFGQTFDPGSYKTQYDTKKGSLTSGLGGEISSALAGQSFFDVGDALTKAGYAQGAQNTNALTSGFTTPAGAAIAGAKDKDKTATRGLGGTGLF